MGTGCDMRMMLTGAGVGLALLAATASGAVYRWVGANGVVHYSDVPVPGAKSVDPDSWEPPSGGSASADGAGGGATASTGTGGAASAKDSEKNCALARKQLNEYKHASQLVRVDAFGEKTKLDAKARAKLIKQALAHVHKYCGGD